MQLGVLFLGVLAVLAAMLSMSISAQADVTVNTTLKEVNAWWNTSLSYTVNPGLPPAADYIYSITNNYSLEAGKPAGGPSLANASLSWAGEVCANVSGVVTCYELNGSYKPPVETVTETQTTTTTIVRTVTYTEEGRTYTKVVTETFTLATSIEQPKQEDRSWLLGAGVIALLILAAVARKR